MRCSDNASMYAQPSAREKMELASWRRQSLWEKCVDSLVEVDLEEYVWTIKQHSPAGQMTATIPENMPISVEQLHRSRPLFLKTILQVSEQRPRHDLKK